MLDPAVKFKWNWCIPSRVIEWKPKVWRRRRRRCRQSPHPPPPPSHDPCVSSLLYRRHNKKNVKKFVIYKIFLERLKDSTHSESKYYHVKHFNVRNDAKRYRVSQRITGSCKMQFSASFPFKMIQSPKLNSGTNFLNTLYVPFVFFDESAICFNIAL